MSKSKIMRDLLAERNYYQRMRDHVIAMAQLRAAVNFDRYAALLKRLGVKP